MFTKGTEMFVIHVSEDADVRAYQLGRFKPTPTPTIQQDMAQGLNSNSGGASYDTEPMRRRAMSPGGEVEGMDYISIRFALTDPNMPRWKVGDRFVLLLSEG